MKIAILYSRVAPGRLPAAWLGLDQQQAVLEDYCRERGLWLPRRRYVDEGELGQTPLADRPSGANLLAALEQADLEEPWTYHLVALSACRLWATAAEGLALVEGLVAVKVGLHLVRDCVELDRSEGVRSPETGEALLASLRREVQAQDLLEKEAAEAARDRTWPRVRHGAPPYGFRLGSGRFLPCPDELRVLGRAWTLREAGLSYRELARRLTLEGVRTRRGGAFTPTSLCRYVHRLRERPALRQRALDSLASGGSSLLDRHPAGAA